MANTIETKHDELVTAVKAIYGRRSAVNSSWDTTNDSKVLNVQKLFMERFNVWLYKDYVSINYKNNKPDRIALNLEGKVNEAESDVNDFKVLEQEIKKSLSVIDVEYVIISPGGMVFISIITEKIR